MQDITRNIYKMSVFDLSVMVLIVILVWGTSGSWICNKYKRLCGIWEKLNMFLFMIQLALLAYLNLHNVKQESSTWNLRAFHTLVEASVQSELYRVALMKMVLYIPFGLFLSCCWKNKKNILKIILKTCAIALICSSLLEVLQVVLHTGNVDIDSVIFGILGCCIGCFAVVFWHIANILLRNDRIGFLIKKYVIVLRCILVVTLFF
jgi:glycopeptide antibiotics resistance protein